MGCQSFEKTFFDYFNRSVKLTAASGYISEDAIADLLMLYKTGARTQLELIVGMHYFDGFSQGQFTSLCDLHSVLQKNNLGAVYISGSFRYHGKVYLFNTSDGQVSIIGSSNLTKISQASRIYDTDIISDDVIIVKDVSKLLNLLRNKGCEVIDRIDPSSIKIVPPQNLFEDYLSVQKLSSTELVKAQNSKTDICFEIQLKDEEKSNLNVYFGKPRINFSNGSKLPRPWYEVELIVSKKITQLPGYPQKDEVFKIITDDGYSFECKVSGDNCKNFRSAGDLSILGRWIKGRMENSNALVIGEKVTHKSLKKYGRDTITLIKTNMDNTWYLDFGVHR